MYCIYIFILCGETSRICLLKHRLITTLTLFQEKMKSLTILRLLYGYKGEKREFVKT